MFSNNTSNSTTSEESNSSDEEESEALSANVEGGDGSANDGNATIDNNIKNVEINTSSSEHKFVWREMKAELPRLPDRFHQCPLTGE